MATIKTSTWADDTDSDGEDIPNTASRRAPAPAPMEQRHAAPEQRQSHNHARPEQSSRPQNEINPNGPFILFVGNLTFEVTDNDLGNFFHNGGCEVLDAKVQMDRETGRSRGFAHVEMKTLASLERGLTASGTDFMGRRLNVDVGKPPRQNERGGRDRDRGFDKNRDRERPGRDDNAPFERGLKLERRERPDRADKFKGGKPKDANAAPAPVERKKYEIKPRTLPIGEVPPAATPSSYSSIFGDAKPRDEKAVEAAPVPNPAAAVVEVEKKLGDLKVSPPAVPVEATAEKAAADKSASKERKPTKQTWTESRASRGEGQGRGRGDGERKERREGGGRGDAGRGRGGRGEGAGGRGKDGARDSKGRGRGETRTAAAPRGNKKAEVTEEKGGSARPVNTLTEHVPASAAETQKVAPVKAKNTNIFAGLGDSDSEED